MFGKIFFHRTDFINISKILDLVVGFVSFFNYTVLDKKKVITENNLKCILTRIQFALLTKDCCFDTSSYLVVEYGY